MPLTVLILTFVVSVGWFIDFLLGAPGNRKLKDQLANFYVSLEEGDWTALYRYPALALLRFMVHVVGENQFSTKYMTRTATISMVATILLFVMSMTWTYVYSAFTEQKCPIPPLWQFLQIPGYMSDFLIFVIVINIIFDYFSWSATQGCLRQIVSLQGIKPIIIVLLSPLAMLAVLYVLYCLYLPLAIMVQMKHYGVHLYLDSLIRITRGNLLTILSFFSSPKSLFVLDCGSRDYTVFSISHINTMQILAVETVIPVALLFVSCVFGILAYITKPVTQRPLSFVVQRMDSSGQRVTVLLIGALVVVLALLAAVLKFQQS
jgi:hypothetical protein